MNDNSAQLLAISAAVVAGVVATFLLADLPRRWTQLLTARMNLRAAKRVQSNLDKTPTDERVRLIHGAPQGAHVLHFRFDLGPDLHPAELAVRIGETLETVDMVIANAAAGPEWDQQGLTDIDAIAVGRLEYRNPLDIIIYIWAGQYAIGAIVGAVVGINAGIQHLKRSGSHTKAIQSSESTTVEQNKALQARAQAEAAAWNVVRDQLGPGMQGRLPEEIVGRAINTLRMVDYEPPAALERQELE